MKIMMCLFLLVFFASPICGALTDADLEQIRKITETANAKTEARIKAYVDLKIEASEKATIAKIEALEKATTARIDAVKTEIEGLRVATATEIKGLREANTIEVRAVKEEVKTSRATLYWWIGLSIAAFGFFYHQLNGIQRTLGRLLERTDIIVEEWMRRSAELDAEREENAALRAENERLKAQLGAKESLKV